MTFAWIYSAILAISVQKFRNSAKFGEFSITTHIWYLQPTFHSLWCPWTYKPQKKHPTNLKIIFKNYYKGYKYKIHYTISKIWILFSILLRVPQAEILLKYGTQCIIFVSRRCILLYCCHSRNFCCIFYVMIHPNIAFFVQSWVFCSPPKFHFQ